MFAKLNEKLWKSVFRNHTSFISVLVFQHFISKVAKYEWAAFKLRCSQGSEGGRGYNMGPPSLIFKKLVNKNAIKPSIGDTPWQFCLESIDPSKDVFKNLSYPSPGFSPVCIYACKGDEWSNKVKIWHLLKKYLENEKANFVRL